MATCPAPGAAAPFDAIDRTFRPKLLRYLAGFVGADEAADLAQVTLLKVSRELPGFRGDASLSTWIYRIATNVALDRLRQRGPEGVPIEADPERETSETVPAALQAPSAQASAERAEMVACVREFVDRLPAHYRTVLVLADVEGLGSEEIAAALRLSVENVKMRLHRARARLRGELRAGCRLERDERNELACDRARGAR